MLLWNEEMENFIISVLYQRELFFQTTFCIKKYRHINIWSWSILVLWGKIYETYRKIYQEIIPNTPYTPIKNIILQL